MTISDENMLGLIEDRNKIVKKVLAKQTKRGIFPILGYSYYEYANSLKGGDKYSAMLYLEYALELGNLDIYFEKQKINFPKIDDTIIIAYLAGFFTCLSMILLFKLNKKRHRK